MSATDAAAAPAANRGVSSYKQLTAELEATQKKLKAVIALAEKAKVTHAQAMQDAMDEMKKKHREELDRFEIERNDRERVALEAREKAYKEESERVARETELATQKRINDAVLRTTHVFDVKYNELRAEHMLLQRQYDDLNEQHRTLQDWQKSAMLHESNWQELKKSMLIEIEEGNKAKDCLNKYRMVLKYMSIHKYVKDVKLKKRLLPLHTGISRLIALILKDETLRDRLLNQHAELARWVHDAIMIEKAEGIQSQLPNTGAAAGNMQGNSTISSNSSEKHFLVNTNVEYLVASLIEVEHVLATCVATVLRYNAHFKSTSAGFFERNSALTAYAMACEKECRDTKDKCARTQSQLNATLALLSRLEIKYLQVARKLGKDDRTLAQRYLQRHGITTVATDEALDDRLSSTSVVATPANTLHEPLATNTWGKSAPASSPRKGSAGASKNASTALAVVGGGGSLEDLSPSASSDSLIAASHQKSESRDEDLSVLSPRSLLKRLNINQTPHGHQKRRSHNMSSSTAASISHDESDTSSSQQHQTLVKQQRGGGGGAPLVSPSGSGDARPSTRSREVRPLTGATGSTHSSARNSLVNSRSASRPGSSPSHIAGNNNANKDVFHTTSRSSNMSMHIPSAAAASIAYSSAAIIAGLNLATSPPQASRQTHVIHAGVKPSSRPNTTKGKRKTKPGEKKQINVYEESSSDEEFTLRPVSYTPPPTTDAIRAIDYEEGDRSIKVDGIPVNIDTIAHTLRQKQKEEKRSSRKRRSSKASAATSSRKSINSNGSGDAEEKQNHDQSSSVMSSPIGSPSLQSETINETSIDPMNLNNNNDSSPLESGYVSGSEAKEQHARSTDGAASAESKPSRTNAQLIPKPTAAWSNKLAAVQHERAHQKRAAQQSHAMDEVDRGVHLHSKSKLAQHSPYQDAVLFGVNSRSASNTSTAQSSMADLPALKPHAPMKPKGVPVGSHSTSSTSSRSAKRKSGGGGNIDTGRPMTSHSGVRPPLKPSPPSTARPLTSGGMKPQSNVHVLSQPPPSSFQPRSSSKTRTSPSKSSRAISSPKSASSRRNKAHADTSLSPLPSPRRGKAATEKQREKSTAATEVIAPVPIRPASTSASSRNRSTVVDTSAYAADEFDDSGDDEQQPSVSEPSQAEPDSYENDAYEDPAPAAVVAAASEYQDDDFESTPITASKPQAAAEPPPAQVAVSSTSDELPVPNIRDDDDDYGVDEYEFD